MRADAAKGKAAEDLRRTGFTVGDKIISRWHGTGNPYPGTAKAIDGDKIQVHYDDDDEEWVPRAAVRRR